MKQEDFEFVKVDEKTDFKELQYSMNASFFLVGKKLFCRLYLDKIALAFESGKWEAIPFESSPADGESIDKKEAYALAKGIKPWDTVQAIYDERAKERADYWNGLVEKTPRRVLGWVSAPFGTHDFLAKGNGTLTDEEYAAILKDIREHNYLFMGEDHQDSCEPCNPVLDDYRHVSFSRRGFGGVMAYAYGDFSNYGYANYTESMFLDEKKKRYPPRKKTIVEENPPYEIEISSDKLLQLKGLLQKANRRDGYALFRLDFVQKTHYWVGDALVITDGKESLYVGIQAILNFESREEFDSVLDNWGEDPYFFIEPEIPSKGPLLIFALRDAFEEYE